MPTRRQMICDEELRLSNGKENAAGRSFLRTSEILCPESTSTAVAIVEQPELRYVAQLCPYLVYRRAARAGRHNVCMFGKYCARASAF